MHQKEEEKQSLFGNTYTLTPIEARALSQPIFQSGVQQLLPLFFLLLWNVKQTDRVRQNANREEEVRVWCVDNNDDEDDDNVSHKFMFRVEKKIIFFVVKTHRINETELKKIEKIQSICEHVSEKRTESKFGTSEKSN